MSKLKHFQTILRDQLVVGPGSSLRILPTRLITGPGLDAATAHSHSQQREQQQQQQQQQQPQDHNQHQHQYQYHHHSSYYDHHYYHHHHHHRHHIHHYPNSQTRPPTILFAASTVPSLSPPLSLPPSSYSSRRHHSRARQREYLCRSPGCLLHTSTKNHAFAASSPLSSSAAATPSSSVLASGSSTTTLAPDDADAPSTTTTTTNTDTTRPSEQSLPTQSRVATESAAEQSKEGHVSVEPVPLEWKSELPWIDPLTHTSYEPGKQPSQPMNSHSGVPTTSTTGSTSFFDQPTFQNTRHNFVFAHGASGFAKHPSKAPTLSPEEDQAYFSVQVGEDSYFRRHDALGVADGVGGWSGANPALYSRKLMHYAFLELEKYDNIEEDAFYDYFNVNPVQILQKSYEQSARDAKREGLIGSSTACLAILRDNELRIANLGDCGVSIIRRNEFIFRTEEQQHSFNYPYQLGTGSTDSPTDAQVFTVKVESGDIIVMGTDGIFDNLFDEDILEEVVRCIDPQAAKAAAAAAAAAQSPYGTGKPPSTLGSGTASGTATTTGNKGVGGLWSGITSGAAKLAAAAAAVSGADTNAVPRAASTHVQSSSSTASLAYDGDDERESVASLFRSEDDLEITGTSTKQNAQSELSPLAAAAVAAAESSAIPPSAALYPLQSSATAAAALATAVRKAQLYNRKTAPEPGVISEALAKRAKSVSEDTRHHGSPFQSRAMQEGLYYQGGKQDDMSVLVAIVKVAEDSPDRR
ncbi:hypothetical protein BGZ94_000777 [Podila epigama]|nr:hypothetical protein BGZ94_000777 [Podila epigama]